MNMHVCLYVSDLIFIRNHPSKFEDLKKAMIKEFEMTNIWLMAYYLSIGSKWKMRYSFPKKDMLRRC